MVLPLLLMLAATGSAPADLPQAAADVRCLITAAAMTGTQSDGPIKAAAAIATLYWMGRVNAVMSDADLKVRMSAEVQQMTGADLKLAAQRCGSEMEARGAAMQAIGKSIEKLQARLDTK